MSAITPPRNTPAQGRAAKDRAAVTFVLAACWTVVSLLFLRALAHTFPPLAAPLPREVLSAILLLGGLYIIGRRMVRDARPLSSIGLVKRPTSAQEFGIGTALGWGIAVALVLPALLTAHLQSTLALDPDHWRQMGLGLLFLACNALTTQLVFTGLPFRALARATSPAVAALCFAALTASLWLFSRTGEIWQSLFVATAQFLFSMAALRTRAIWLPLGLQFGWGVSLSLFFGVPSFYWPSVAGPVRSYVTGPRWLTGAYLGPEASLWAVLVIAAAMVVLWRATRDFAWHYTYEPLVGAGYPMEVAPPQEHARMEAEGARKSEALVQILPTAPAPPRD